MIHDAWSMRQRAGHGMEINWGWWVLAGPTLLLLFSIYGLYDHLAERSHRNDVLARGMQAQARVVRAFGYEGVVVQWTDDDGRERSATSWVGKPFARQSIGKTVTIKYLRGSTREPVILSEAAERERVNAWWVNQNLAMAGAAIVFGIFLVMRGRSTGPAR